MPDGNIGDRNDLDSTGNAEMPHGFARQSVLDLVNVIDEFDLGVFHPDFVIDNRRVYIQIHVLINAHGQNKPAMLAVERGQVCSASAERYSKRSSGDDHRFSYREPLGLVTSWQSASGGNFSRAPEV